MPPAPPRVAGATLLAAPGDGIEPCLLLSVDGPGGGPAAQYLFNVPEGFARAALEHRVRPGARLRAAFVTSASRPAAVGGLGALVLRLKADGHAELRLVGPPGVATSAGALRHVAAWRHPAVFVDELEPGGDGVAYGDDLVDVWPLWGEGEGPGVPTWAVARVDGLPPAASTPSDASSSSSSSSDTSSSSGTPESSSDASPSPSPSSGVPSSDMHPPAPPPFPLPLAPGAAHTSPPARPPPPTPPPPPEYELVHGDGAALYALPAVAAAARSVGRGGGRAAAARTLGYVVRLRRGGGVVVVAAAAVEADAVELAAHPGLAALAPLRPACFHLTPRHLALAPAYLSWAARAGMAVLGDGAPRPSARLAHVSAGRQLARLAAVDGAVFPPHGEHAGYDTDDDGGAAVGCGDPAAGRPCAPPRVVTCFALRPGARGGLDLAMDDDEEGLLPPLDAAAERQWTAAVLGGGQGCGAAGGGSGGDAAAGGAGGGAPHATNGSCLANDCTGDDGTGPARPPAKRPRSPPSNRSAAATLRARLGGTAPPPADDQHCTVHPPAGDQHGTAPPPAGAQHGAAAPLPAGAQHGAAAPSPASDRNAAPPRPAPPCHPPPAVAVTFLGTGCAEPCAHRGASAIHLAVTPPGGGPPTGALLDVGEGAAGGLRRAHGRAGARARLGALACVWVSHKHPDHMLGLLGVLGGRPAGAEPLLVMGPHCVGRYLAESVPAAPDWDLGPPPAASTAPATAAPDPPAAPPPGPAGPPPAPRYAFVAASGFGHAPAAGHRARLEDRLGLTPWGWAAVRADHCPDAWAVCLRAPTWSLAFGGDGRPSPSVARMARGVDLLIHEATFERGMEAEADRKKHSTAAAALGVARAAGARRTVLTHFSQRYPGAPPDAALHAADWRAAGAAPAWDGMAVAWADLERLPAVGAAAVAGLARASAAARAGGGE